MELGLDSARVVQKCGAGLFPVDVCKENGDYRVVMTQGKAVVGEPLPQEYQARVLDALGVTWDDLRPGCPMASASVGSPKLMVVLNDLDKLCLLYTSSGPRTQAERRTAQSPRLT